jgi:DNA-binding transcriptional LysR family regulator
VECRLLEITKVQELDIRRNEKFFREIMPELATFHAAYLYETRSEAAGMLGKDATNVSRSIIKLETLLGCRLVDPKEKKSVKLTDAGVKLLKFAEGVMRLKDGFYLELTDLNDGSDITVATTNYAWLTYAEELEGSYRNINREGSLNPGKGFWQQDRVWEELEESVLKGQADVGIYSYPPSRKKEFPKDLTQIDWIEEEYVFVVPAKIAAEVKRDRLSISDLAGVMADLPRVVHYRREHKFDRTALIEQYLKQQRVLSRYPDDWLFGANTIDEIKHTLIERGGISFLPWPTVAKEHKLNTLKAFPIRPALRPRVMKIIHRAHGCRKAVDDFIRAAKRVSYSRKFPDDVVRISTGHSRS